MTYNLEEFKAWLNAEPSRKNGTSETMWENILGFFSRNKEVWQETIQGLLKKTAGEVTEIVIQKWMSEVDSREREREQNNMMRICFSCEYTFSSEARERVSCPSCRSIINIMTTIQEALSNYYPDKNTIEEINLCSLVYAVGLENNELVIADYPNLKKVWSTHSRWQLGIHKLTINNCPKLTEVITGITKLEELKITNCLDLKKIDCRQCQLTNLSLNNTPQLTSLSCDDNKLTNLDLSSLTSLEILECSGNNLTKLEVNKCSNLTSLFCERNPIANLDISNNLKLTGLFCGNTAQPIRQLAQKIQDQEKALTQLKSNETANHQKITQLENELQQLKNLKENLEQQFQAKEELLNKSVGDLTTQLEQIKTEKNDLVTKLKDHETTIRNNRVAWEKYASEVKLRFQVLKENKEQINEQAKLLETYYEEFGEIKLDEEQNDEEQEKKQQEIKKTLEELKESLQKGSLAEVWNLFFTLGSSIDQLKNLQVDTITSCQEQIEVKEQELIRVRNETSSSTASLREEITNLKIELKSTQEKNNQLIALEQQLTETKQQLTDQQTKSGELESQLTSLALGSSLLVNQVEELTNQKTQAEQETERIKFEKEIKENLLASKENELNDSNNTISQQATKLNAYQQIIRNSEANLSKAQDIISTKTEQIEQLEQEKDNLTEQLEQTEEDLKQLEISFIDSQTKINELETRIKELESDNANQLEIDNLKQQLVQAKNNHQQEKVNLTQQIAQLQSELTNIKNRESQLSLKIQALTTQQEKVNEEIKTISLWTKIRTPFLIISGLGTIIFAIRLLKGKSEE